MRSHPSRSQDKANGLVTDRGFSGIACYSLCTSQTSVIYGLVFLKLEHKCNLA